MFFFSRFSRLTERDDFGTKSVRKQAGTPARQGGQVAYPAVHHTRRFTLDCAPPVGGGACHDVLGWPWTGHPRSLALRASVLGLKSPQRATLRPVRFARGRIARIGGEVITGDGAGSGAVTARKGDQAA